MNIQTSRFGIVKVTAEDILTFPEGILGFSDLRQFVLLDDPGDEIFAWLQSCERSEIAFPVLEPELFVENYRPDLGRSDFGALQAANVSQCRFFSIITIPGNPVEMTANLKAPIVLNVPGRLGRQCVLQDSALAIREPIFSKLQQRVVQIPPRPIKSQALDWGVAIRLSDVNAKSDNSPTL
jgi:flagellar assembly factor FliW